MATKHFFSIDQFLNSVREYFSMDAMVSETDSAGKPAGPTVLRHLAENRFYGFNAEAVCALCHAAEDMALEEANGSLLAAFQQFKNFNPHRERYGQLAATIDRVDVLGSGPAPRRTRRIQFVPDRAGACRDFRLVMFTGRRHQALVMARQVNKAARFEAARFLGFYTFDAGVIRRVRQDVQDVITGRSPTLREFDRLQAIDHAAKQISAAFSRERMALSQAVRRLQLEGDRYQTGHFTSDLERVLNRLHEWKARLPQLLARAEGR